MRISGSVLWFLLLCLTACGLAHETANAAAAPSIAACPAQLTSETPLPEGARILGRVEDTLTLWHAEVSFGIPDDITDDRVLSTLEQSEATPLPEKRYLYRYDVRPGKTPIRGEFERFLLACSYGTSANVAAAQQEGSAMLLIPLPYKVKARCDVIHDNSDAEGQIRPLISASCERVK